MKDAWPVEAKAIGGRHYRTGRRATTSIRTSTPTRSSTRSPTAPSCCSKAATCPTAGRTFASYAHGTKGSAIISSQSHTPAYSRIFDTQVMPIGRRPRRNEPDVVWKWSGGENEPNPYQVEWDDLIAAIRRTSLTTR